MTNRLKRIARGIVALALGAAPLAGAETARYVGASPAGGANAVFFPLCVIPSAIGQPSVGGACFLAPRGARTMSVTVADVGSESVAANIEFVVDSYEPTVEGPEFCGSVAGVPVPAGTDGVIIRTLVAESLRCDPAGIPTSGTIEARF